MSDQPSQLVPIFNVNNYSSSSNYVTYGYLKDNYTTTKKLEQLLLGYMPLTASNTCVNKCHHTPEKKGPSDSVTGNTTLTQEQNGQEILVVATSSVIITLPLQPMLGTAYTILVGSICPGQTVTISPNGANVHGTRNSMCKSRSWFVSKSDLIHSYDNHNPTAGAYCHLIYAPKTGWFVFQSEGFV